MLNINLSEIDEISPFKGFFILSSILASKINLSEIKAILALFRVLFGLRSFFSGIGRNKKAYW